MCSCANRRRARIGVSGVALAHHSRWSSSAYRPTGDQRLVENRNPGNAAIPVFVNRNAGGTDDSAGVVLARKFEEANIAAEVRSVDPDCLGHDITRAAGSGTPIVGVAGGDGSVRTAADVLAGRPTILAPLPLGTLNHFARRVGLGQVDQAVRAMASGRSMHVPVGLVDDHIFLNTATFGIYAEVVRRRETWRRWLAKWPSAALSSAVSLIRLKMVEMELDVDGSRLHRSTPLLWIGIGRSSFPFAHQAPVQTGDPRLEVVIVRTGGRFSTGAMLVRLLARQVRQGAPHHDAGLEVFHARKLLLRGSSPIGVTLDGEVYRWDPPIFIAIQKGALSVACIDEGAE